MQLCDLSDDQVLSNLTTLHGKERTLIARILAYLVEVDRRGLHLEAAYPSLYELCIGELKLSESEAYRRVRGAALVKRFPSLLERLESGEIHLSALLILGRHLTDSNLEMLVSKAAGKTKQEVEALVARHFPKPDIPSLIQELPPSSASSSQISLSMPTTSASSDEALSKNTRTRIEPLSEARFKMQLTASKDLVDKVERAKDLMRHSNPTGDLAVLMNRAFDLLIENLEKEKLGKTSRPQRNPRPAKPDRMTQATTREIYARDEEQCTFVNEKTGKRCSARGFLERDHAHPRALGGTSDAGNMRIRCRAHNLWSAEKAFGKEYVARCIERRRRSKAVPSKAPVSNNTATTPTASTKAPTNAHPATTTKANANLATTTNAKAPVNANPTGHDSVYEVAKRALVLLGFGESDVRRSLAVLMSKESKEAVPIASIIRDGLRLLT